MDFAKDMIETCYQMYAKMPLKLSPEIAYFNPNPAGSEDIIVKVKSKEDHCFVSQISRKGQGSGSGFGRGSFPYILLIN